MGHPVLFDIKKERLEKALSMTEPFTRREDFESRLNSKGISAFDKRKIAEAFALNESCSYVGRPENYIAHPVRVAEYCLCFAEKVSADEILLALIHNILEVSNYQVEQLQRQFGDWVAAGCVRLTIDRNRSKNDPQYYEEYYAALYKTDSGVQRVKIFDKLDNLLILFVSPSDTVRENYVKEIEQRLLPMVRRQLPDFVGVFENLVKDVRRIGHKTLAQFQNNK